jgi:alkanesulfonate monooxygenase SsuD/methylene tetrahydromethanopterin reductase-like flavin-dependent oxidoreductase (luciferase family)
MWPPSEPSFDGQRFELHGKVLDIPYRGPGATGLGKPLKLTGLHPREIPVYVAAIGPRNVALATEIADGILPIFWSPTGWKQAFGDTLGAVDTHRFDVAPGVRVVVGDDLEACRNAVRPFLALYIGGMGARGRNFYNDLVCRLGYEGAARRIQDLYLAGDKHGAARAVPDELIDDVALVGPPERIAERLEAWRSTPVTTLIVWPSNRRAIEVMAEALL